MARILVHTNDDTTVLDERTVKATDISDQNSSAILRDRLEEATCDAEGTRVRRHPRIKRLAVIVSNSGYRDLSG
jgi:hypothetical protein